MNDLPDALLLHVLSYLPVKERCCSGRVCRRWRNIVADNSLWRHVDLLSYHLDLNRMWKILRAHFSSCLKTMKIRGFAHTGTTRKRKKSSISDSMLKELSNRCPNLTVLHLQDCKTENISVENIPSTVKELSISKSSWKPRWLKDQQKYLTNINSLILTRTVRIDRFDLQDIAQITELRKLDLSGCYRIKDDDIEVVAKYLVKLEILNLSFTHIDDLGVHHIARNLKNLKELYLRSCDLSDGMLANLIICPHLKVLDISDNERLTSEGIKSLTKLEKLRVIK